MTLTQSTRPYERLLRLDPSSRLTSGGGQLALWSRFGRVAVGERDRPMVAVLQALATTEVTPTDLERLALATAGATATDDEIAVLARLHWLLDRIGNALEQQIGPAGEPGWLRVTALTGDLRFTHRPYTGNAAVALSRLALLRRRDGRMVVESGLAPFRVGVLHEQALALVGALAEPRTVADLAARLGLDETAIRHLVGFLAAAQLTDAVDPAADQWDPHELYFHSRSRCGRTDESFGATFPFVDVRPPLPPVKPAPAGTAVVLPRPDFDALRATDPPLVLVQEARRSVRGFGVEPMTLAQLGEFLYRVGRVRSVYGPDHDNRMPYEGVDRPYPTGGASGDLEIYVTAHRVAGLPRAAYHYDAWEHRLVQVCDDPTLIQGLLAGAAQATGGTPTPDALITFTSRFGRLTWKYDAMGYAATLKHVGVAYQTAYLVATAMGLAPCGLGSGDAHLSARAFGLDWQVESSVGEFMLGSLPRWADGTDPHQGRTNWRGANDPDWARRAGRLLSAARHDRAVPEEPS
ncbi:SagB family peptide dehydrogenase [Micromonospora maris]|uniref:SagB/ThcOx family dehydrogenase n=1 Tax=Micromonospora maris TaxID=1003110 RepID=UPI002E0E5B64|nr:SagB family peptide dehydrogenase [Micromonospora maris]WSK40450.1 SagB family peptide dehydrogenase [Micromonospora maris]